MSERLAILLLLVLLGLVLPILGIIEPIYAP